MQTLSPVNSAHSAAMSRRMAGVISRRSSVLHSASTAAARRRAHAECVVEDKKDALKRKRPHGHLLPDPGDNILEDARLAGRTKVVRTAREGMRRNARARQPDAGTGRRETAKGQVTKE